MSVVTAVEETGPCSKKLTIEVPAEAVEAEMGRVVGKFRKSVNIPGFRRGKVPASVIRKRFGDEIRREVADRLLPRYWRQAQAEKDLDPILPPQVEDLEMEPGKPMTVVASVELRPEIQLGDYREFDLPNEDPEPSEADVEEALLDFRRRNATWNEVDRPAAQGDLVMARVARDDEEDDDETPAEPLHIELGGQGVDEELTLALTGRSAGQSAIYKRQDEDGEEHEVSIEVVMVKEQDLPELDDEMASKVGLESVDKLTEAVRENLRHSKQQFISQQRQRQMLEQLRERHPVELPKRVVDTEGERILQDHAERLHSQGVDIENAGIDWEQLAEQARPEAERRVHERLLLDAIASEENLRLDENEFERVLSTLAAQQKQSSLALRQQLSEAGRLEALRAQMLRDQTVKFLLGDSDESGESSASEAEDSTGDGSET